MTGQDPVGVIDRRDRNTCNNRWNNLFDVPSSHNSLNRGHRNKTGFMGVGYDRTKDRYQGAVHIDTKGVKRKYRTRWVPTPEEAHRELVLQVIPSVLVSNIRIRISDVFVPYPETPSPLSCNSFVTPIWSEYQSNNNNPQKPSQ